MKAFILAMLAATGSFAAGQFTIESNVVYGMYSGTALMMDVYKPATPNGYGIIFISGSGWTTPLAYSAPELKTNSQSKLYATALANAGYTVFPVNHRSLPRFRYPVPVEDVQRAVRFIRTNAKRFGINADRIGASGGSSGGHLVSMLGTLDGMGTRTTPTRWSANRPKCNVWWRARPLWISSPATMATSFWGWPSPPLRTRIRPSTKPFWKLRR